MSDEQPTRPGLGGVWALPVRAGRPKPYGCQWRETVWDPTANGGDGAEVVRRPSEFFPTAELRDGRMAQLRKDRKKGSVRTATRQEIEEWRAFRAATGNVPWQQVVAGWRADMMARGVVECTVTVDDAVARELARCKKLVEREKMSPMTLRHKTQKLGLFSEQFGHLLITAVKGPEIETWIDDFDHVLTEGTFNNYLKQVRVTLQPYVDSGMLPRNPCDVVASRDESTDHVGILTVQETAHLFAFALQSAKYRVAIGRLALEAFVGLRFSSGCRVELADINFKDKGVLLPKKKLKTGKRHYIDGVVPKQIWRWLAVTPAECWALTPRQYMQLKTDLFRDAQVLHPHNCFRHSFCTYDVAAHKNPARTAYLLCHRNQNLIWSRYKGVQARGRVVTERDGKLYQLLTPRTAARLARGYAPPAELGLQAA